MKVLVLLFGPQIAILFGNPLAMNRPVLDFPLFIAHFHPAAQVLSIKQRHPVLSRQLGFGILSPSSRRYQEQEHQRESSSKHSASKNGFEWVGARLRFITGNESTE